jgi:glycosyltransferase involved in cell wall biosynthesis
VDVVVVGGGPWSPDTNFPTHHTARIVSREHRVLYLCRDTHVSLLGQATGRLRGFHSWTELVSHVASRPSVEHVGERLWISSLAGPAALFPLSYPPAARAVSVRLVIRQLRHALEELGFMRPLLWFYWWFFPEIASAIDHSLALYDIYDDHAEYDYVRRNPHRQQYSRRIEAELLQKVDLAFAVSGGLVRQHSTVRPVEYLPNGVDISVAERAAAMTVVPADIAGLPRPIVGYLGSYDSRLDWTMVEAMVDARPDWSFVFVGGGTTGPARPHANLHLMGNRSYTAALEYVNQFDLALIPFVRDALTEAVCPAKLFDYLALGKPILSTRIPAVSEIAGCGDEVYRADSVEEMLAVGDVALRETSDLPSRRMALARSLTWEHRTEHAMRSIEKELRRRGRAA